MKKIILLFLCIFAQQKYLSSVAAQVQINPQQNLTGQNQYKPVLPGATGTAVVPSPAKKKKKTKLSTKIKRAREKYRRSIAKAKLAVGSILGGVSVANAGVTGAEIMKDKAQLTGGKLANFGLSTAGAAVGAGLVVSGANDLYNISQQKQQPVNYPDE